MSKENQMFEETQAPVQERSATGAPFQGRELNPVQSAKFEVLKQAAAELAESPFVEKITVSCSPELRHGHVFIDLPAAVVFRADRKDKLPAILNLADTYTIVTQSDGGIRITVTVLDLWRE